MAFTGSPPSSNYLDILQLENTNLGLPAATLQTVRDAAGNASLLALSQQEVAVTGVFNATVAAGLIMGAAIPLTADELISDKITYKTNTDVGIFFGSGDPEGAVTASPGSLMLRDDGTTGSSVYIKEVGTGNTGWVAFDIVSTFLDLTDTPGAFMAGRWVKVNAGGTALEFTLPPILNPTGAAQGEVLFYDGAAWTNLGVGTDGYVLTTHGAGSDPTWEAASAVASWLDLTDTDPTTYSGQGGKYVRVNSTPDGLEFATPDWITAPGSPAQGQILYYNGSAWVALAVGTSGQVLTTNGAGANPSWETSGAGVSTFIALSDTPSGYGSPYQILTNSGSSVAWTDISSILFGGISGAPDAGQILSWNGLVADWIDAPAGTFIGLTDTPASFEDQGEKYLRVNTGATAIEFVDAPTGGGSKAYVTTEYDTGDTWRGKPIYAIVVDFGAGPNNTTKSVASGLGVNDVFHVVDMQVMANDAQYGWVAQEDSANKASFTYNKLDYKVYCTTTNDLSGVEYQVLLKYIKEPVTMSGSDPHVIVTVSGGTWGGLAQGVHLLTPVYWNYVTVPLTGVPSTLDCTWRWTDGGTGASSFKITLQGQYGGDVAGRKSTGKMHSYDGTATLTSNKAYSTTGAVPSPYNQRLAIGDRLFTSYTIGAITVTLGRASDFTADPA